MPIKAALGLKGLCSPDLRLPMVQMPESKLAELRGILDTLGI